MKYSYLLIGVKLQYLKVQVHILEIILNSSNSILNLRIVSSRDQIHREEGLPIKIKEFFLLFWIKKVKIIDKKEDVHEKCNESIKRFQTPFKY